MKKIFTILTLFLCFLCCTTKSYADKPQLLPCKINVQLQDDLSVANPPEYITVVIDDAYKLPNGKHTNAGTQLTLKVLKANEEKRGKLNASIKTQVVKLDIPALDKTYEIDNPEAIVKIIPYQKLDVVDKTLDVGTSVANYFVSNIAVPINLARGFVKNETGNRFSSAGKTAYEKSVLSYASKGKTIDAKKGDMVTLSFYMRADIEE